MALLILSWFIRHCLLLDLDIFSVWSRKQWTNLVLELPLILVDHIERDLVVWYRWYTQMEHHPSMKVSICIESFCHVLHIQYILYVFSAYCMYSVQAIDVCMYVPMFSISHVYAIKHNTIYTISTILNIALHCQYSIALHCLAIVYCLQYMQNVISSRHERLDIHWITLLCTACTCAYQYFLNILYLFNTRSMQSIHTIRGY